ncbi:hypothetical protein M0R04_04630 [Candidatus Dojkabacteria bacterium]|jgi:hypothetical protein|nr:hypothetical protein [Candidatus Dojkabacteria bacterium]
MNDEMMKAVIEVCEKISNMTKEEFESHLVDAGYYDTPKCHPDTCAGECQGCGGCYRCDDFHNNFQRSLK